MDFLFRNGFLQKNYGHSYNVEVITEIIVRLQNKDKSKMKNKKDQSSSPNKSKPLVQRPPAPKQDISPSHTFKKGDIVVYQGQKAEVMKVTGNLVEISYPASQYIMNRRKTTVHARELRTSRFTVTAASSANNSSPNEAASDQVYSTTQLTTNIGTIQTSQYLPFLFPSSYFNPFYVQSTKESPRRINLHFQYPQNRFVQSRYPPPNLHIFQMN